MHIQRSRVVPVLAAVLVEFAACSSPRPPVSRSVDAGKDIDAKMADASAVDATTSFDASGDAGPARLDVSAPVLEVGVPLPAAEVGFIDLPPQSRGASTPARMFYSFHPADDDAAEKPLFVAFNGGPGFPTSSGLLAYGTGPQTLDPNDASLTPSPNPSSFTRMGSVLYLDERQAGFSYGVGGTSSARDGDCTFSLVGDAADFVRATVEFLDAHSALTTAPVFFLGESYGGTRAATSLHLLYHYTDASLAIDNQLRSLLAAHFAALAPGSVCDTPACVAQQFRGGVLIEPLLFGALQYTAQEMLMPSDPYINDVGDADTYDTQKPNGWSNALFARSASALASVDASAALLGVDLGTVPALLPAGRAGAYRMTGTIDAGTEGEYVSRFGPLPDADGYYSGFACACGETSPVDSTSPEWLEAANWFLDDLYWGQFFITNARYDAAILAPAIPMILATVYPDLTVDTTSDAGAPRPGRIRFTVPSLADGGAPIPLSIRFPPYDESGHEVAVTQPADFAADVTAWLAALPASP